ncbi:MAG: DUF262 domain-containing HNH endonuclease family protein [Terracidiphilus sp.]
MIEPTYANLQKLFADRVFRIPAYQRFYSWQPRQRADLFSDIHKLSLSGSDQHHFMATIVCSRTGESKAIGTSEYTVNDIVDGQQRLTTLIILLKCIELALPEGSFERSELANILVKRDRLLILLQTNNVNAYLFNGFVREGKTAERKNVKLKADLNLVAAIQECSAFVKKWQSKKPATDLMRLVLHRLGFVVFDTVDPRAVYTLFEVLNSRGLAVDWLDKTKSTLMGRAFELNASSNAANAAIEDLQKLWGKIYDKLAEENVSGEEVLRITATLYFGLEQGKPRSAEDSLDVLREACDSVQMPEQISLRLLRVTELVTEIYRKTQWDVLTEILHSRILAVALHLAKGVSDSEREKLLEQWERVTFRIFGLLQKDSRTKVGDYVRLASRIVKGDPDYQSFNQIMAALRSLGRDYPIKDAIGQGFLRTDIYWASPEVCRYILWNFEEFLASATGRNATVDVHARAAIWKLRAVDSIEHIFPQSPGSGWKGKTGNRKLSPETINSHVHRIGNLLLLPQPINAQAQARPFGEKRSLYRQHHLRMIDEVCAFDDWTFDSIDERELALATWAEKRWDDI